MKATIRVYTIGGKFLGEDKIDTEEEDVIKFINAIRLIETQGNLAEFGEIVLDHIEAGNTVVIGEDLTDLNLLDDDS